MNNPLITCTGALFLWDKAGQFLCCVHRWFIPTATCQWNELLCQGELTTDGCLLREVCASTSHIHRWKWILRSMPIWEFTRLLVVSSIVWRDISWKRHWMIPSNTSSVADERGQWFYPHSLVTSGTACINLSSYLVCLVWLRKIAYSLDMNILNHQVCICELFVARI